MQEKRGKTVVLKLSEEEYGFLQANARDVNLTMSGYLRSFLVARRDAWKWDEWKRLGEGIEAFARYGGKALDLFISDIVSRSKDRNDPISWAAYLTERLKDTKQDVDSSRFPTAGQTASNGGETQRTDGRRYVPFEEPQ